MLLQFNYSPESISCITSTYPDMLSVVLRRRLLCLQGHVVMGTNAKSPYQQVIEKTKDLAYKSQMLVMAVEKKLRQKGGKEVGFC